MRTMMKAFQNRCTCTYSLVNCGKPGEMFHNFRPVEAINITTVINLTHNEVTDGLGVWCIRFQHWWWMGWKFSKGRISAIYQAVLNVTRFHDQKNRHIYMVYRSCIGGFRTQNPLRNLLKVFFTWIKATFCRILFQFWSWMLQMTILNA